MSGKPTPPHGLLSYEFPGFDESTLPVIPAGFEPTHWHNDACPTWINWDAGLVLNVDYPKAEDREFPELPRFSLGRIVGGQSTDYILSSDQWGEVLEAIQQEVYFHGDRTG